jgi:hypothetical protein
MQLVACFDVIETDMDDVVDAGGAKGGAGTGHLSHPVLEGNWMRTMYVPGSEIHVHIDYIIGLHHTLLKIIAEMNTLLHHCRGP